MQADPDSFNVDDVLLFLEQKSPEPPKTSTKPLPFERLISGIAPKSQSALFQLPFDILDEIFNYIPFRSLPSFALASRDCCRLARDRQFTNITLDYSPNSWALAHRLLSEADSGCNGPTRRAQLPPIGPAVRQVAICTAKDYIEQYHSVSIWEPRSLRTEKLGEIMERYRRYIRTIQLVLANSLPNVETIIWTDRVLFDEETYLALSRSPVQNLVLNEVAADGRYTLHGSSTQWPLRILHLGMADVPNYRLRSRTMTMCNALFLMSASHLESLTWVQKRGPNYLRHSFSELLLPRPSFSALRKLQMSGVGFEDDSLLESLINPSGRVRRLGVQRSDVADYLSKCGTLKSLEVLTWLPQTNELLLDNHPDEPNNQVISFLRSNSHLKELYLRRAYTADFLDTHLLPLLGSSFYSLTSLSLVGKDKVLKETSLELIGKIHSLQLLHLTAGDQMYAFQWVVDHEAIRRHLSQLKNLKTLLLSRDVRTIESGPPSQHTDDSSTDSDDASDDTSSMTLDENPNTDLAAILASVALGVHTNPTNEVEGEDEEEVETEDEEEENEDTSSTDTTPHEQATYDEDHNWHHTAPFGQPFSISGSERYGHSSLSSLLHRMQDEKVESEAQKYFTAFEKLERLHMGRQEFDRGFDEVSGLLWRNKRWGHPEDLVEVMLGGIGMGGESGVGERWAIGGM